MRKKKQNLGESLRSDTERLMRTREPREVSKIVDWLRSQDRQRANIYAALSDREMLLVHYKAIVADLRGLDAICRRAAGSLAHRQCVQAFVQIGVGVDEAIRIADETIKIPLNLGAEKERAMA